MASNNARRYTLEDVVCEEAKEKLKLYYEPWYKGVDDFNPDVKRDLRDPFRFIVLNTTMNKVNNLIWYFDLLHYICIVCIFIHSTLLYFGSLFKCTPYVPSGLFF
jgi:hypothetical protein